MICHTCGHDNLPGSDYCAACQIDLTDLDRPMAMDRIERSLLEDVVGGLPPRMPIALLPTATLQEAMTALLQNNIGAVLVTSAEGRLLGILSERDLLTRVAGLVEDYPARLVAEFMTPTPEVASPHYSLAFVLHQMDSGGYRHLPVVHQGKPVGMVSVRDLLRHLTRLCASKGG